MPSRKTILPIKNGLAPESLAFRLAYTAEALRRVDKGQSLPSVLAALFSGAVFDIPARGAIQDIAFHTLRNLGMSRFLAGELTRKPPEPLLLRNLLYCALALLLPEDNGKSRYEPYTVVDQAVQAAASIPQLSKAKGLVNAVLRRFLREQSDLLKTAMHQPEATWNYPVWWINRIQKTYPDDWESILATGNTPPPLTLRINCRKTTIPDYIELAKTAGFHAEPVGPYAIKLDNPVPVNKIPGFMDGLVSVQDAAAQLAAPLLNPEDGMRVLDACAAPGGKSGHLLEMADIDLLALDCDGNRLQKIDENLKRLGLKAKTRTGDATQRDWWDGNPFDCILADVPCTASGIIRRHPDIRWLRRPNDSQELAVLSMRILENLWDMLKPGGKLLFATCSIWPEESERQADSFAIRSGAIRLDAPGQLLPIAKDTTDHDGLFYALFKKT